MQAATPHWNISMMSLRHLMHSAGATVPTPQEGMQSINIAYKNHNSALKQFGHALAFKRRAVAITKLDPVSHLPMTLTRDDSLTEGFKHPTILSGVDIATFFAQYKMLDVNDPGYDGHVCLVYLETNKAAVAVAEWVAKLGIQVAIHELINLVLDGNL